MKVYIAYKYNATNAVDVLANIGMAIKVGRDVALLGLYPYIPHLDCLLAIEDSKKRLGMNYYYQCSLEFLKVCDVMLLVDKNDLETSKGVLAEYQYCLAHNIPVYKDIYELVKFNV
jgi:hypothetical protein